MANWNSLWTSLVHLAEQVVQEIITGYLVVLEDQFEDCDQLLGAVEQLLLKTRQVVQALLINVFLVEDGVKSVLVNLAVVQQVWTLENGHLSGGDSVDVWNLILVWNSRKEVVYHIITI